MEIDRGRRDDPVRPCDTWGPVSVPRNATLLETAGKIEGLMERTLLEADESVSPLNPSSFEFNSTPSRTKSDDTAATSPGRSDDRLGSREQADNVSHVPTGAVGSRSELAGPTHPAAFSPGPISTDPPDTTRPKLAQLKKKLLYVAELECINPRLDLYLVRWVRALHTSPLPGLNTLGKVDLYLNGLEPGEIVVRVGWTLAEEGGWTSFTVYVLV